jgi:nucleoid-associated protein YgaU
MDQTLDDLASKVGPRPRVQPGAANTMNMPPVSPAGSVVSPTVPGRTYTVVAGDTLWKIALKQFGTKSAGAVDAIVEANRTLVSDRDQLKTGQVLVIPELAGGPAAAPANPPGPAASKPEPKTKPAGRVSEPVKEKDKDKEALVRNASARWYQVRKNDRYYSIARDQLGDGSRWHEIHELNKDKFPDPEMIREGVRIKLPAEAVADIRDRRR